MLHLIPAVKEVELTGGYLAHGGVFCRGTEVDARLLAALEQLPQDEAGAEVIFRVGDGAAEDYHLTVEAHRITVEAGGPAGAFYAIQTLRQLFTHDRVPCLRIADRPDFAYRGFYHDVTRGRVPTLETLKALADRMAYHKLNSLQLYVEHVFPFAECRALNESAGCLTPEELRELDSYCRERFIDFVPSLSTFGHLYELLNQEPYRHLRMVSDCGEINTWHARMCHHTIDPLHPESFPLVRHLMDQYAPCFGSEKFNICCDETFDLQEYEQRGVNVGQVYADFVGRLIDDVKRRGKQAMLWADILLKYPETIERIPDDVLFLNWNYAAQPPEETVARLAAAGKRQIVCPGTSAWNRLCEDVDTEEQNISRMARYGRQYGAEGLLNTNWGDWGHLCSPELAQYGLLLGAEKAWSEATAADGAWESHVDALLYEREGAVACLRAVSALQTQVSWKAFVRNYDKRRFDRGEYCRAVRTDVAAVQAQYEALRAKLTGQTWRQDRFRQELLLAAEGVCLMAELNAIIMGEDCVRCTDTEGWLAKFGSSWLKSSKPSELWRIEEVFRWCEAWRA